MPEFIALGHELSHSLGIMDGASAPLSKEQVSHYKHTDGETELVKTALEELITVG